MKHSLLSSFIASVLGLGAVAACGGGTASTSTTTPQARSAAADDASCPVSIPGTSVTVEDTDSGAALVFVTTGDVVELRNRVAAMAKMHNEHHGSMGALPDGNDAGGGDEGHDMSAMGSGHDMSAMGSGHDMSAMGSGHDMSNMSGHDMSKMGAGGMMSVHSRAERVDIDGGAKLVFTSGAADVAKLQGELRMHAEHMSTGTCAMEHH